MKVKATLVLTRVYEIDELYEDCETYEDCIALDRDVLEDDWELFFDHEDTRQALTLVPLSY